MDRLLPLRNGRCFGCVLMKPFPVICINAKGQELALTFGATYEVTEDNGDCWYISGLAQGGDFAKRRFITPDEWPAWLDGKAKYHLDKARKYLDLLRWETPDARF